VGVVGAAEGYPGTYRKGDVITGLEEAERVDGAVVFHAGTKTGPGNSVLTDGGRVLCVTALGASVEEARKVAYSAYDEIRWDGKFCRRDIGVRRARAAVVEG
jgi:phosphoribosylamine--glycine ligase